MNGPTYVAKNSFARCAALCLAIACPALAGCGGGGGGGSSAATQTVATPLFFVQTGPGLPTLALISDTTPGAQIYFTTNGATPTTASTLYTGPIVVSASETIQAIAAATGYTTSAVGSATYVLLQAAAPVFSVAPGVYSSTQTVAIASSTPGAQIYYTTDGSTPTIGSTVYIGPITVSSSTTLMALAVEPGYTASTVATAAYVITPPAPGAALTGLVQDGQRPVSGAHVYLFAAGTTGYGQASVSLLNPAQTGASDSTGAYVTSDANGSFSITGDYICATGQLQLYLLALGGNAGSGFNPAAGFMAAIGTCPTSSSPALSETVNEVTTVAAAYAMAGFATDATHVSSSGTPLAQIGVANAFANAANLATTATGVALATTPAANATVPQAEINTLANALAACVESTSACSSLFTNALSGGTSGTAPTETATAAIHIAHNPGANVAALYALATAAPAFTPALSAAPTSFALWLSYTGVADSSSSVAIDGAGSVWITNTGGNNVVKLSNAGALLSGTKGYSGAGFSQPLGIAIDPAGNAWVSDARNGLTKLSNSGGVVFAGIQFPRNTLLNGPTRLAIDGAGNVWVPNYAGSSVSLVSNSDSLLSTFTGGGIGEPEAVAVDGVGNAWVANGAGGSISRISTAAGVTQLTGGGLSATEGIAIDSSGDAWVANEIGNAVVELSNPGAFLSGAGGYTGSGSGGLSIAVDGAGNIWSGSISGLTELSTAGTPLLQIPALGRSGTAIDGSGNVWLVGPGVTQIIGAATPVIAPLAAGLPAKPTANGTSNLGTRP